MLAEARLNMYQATKDEAYLTRPHMRFTYINDWCKEWEPDESVPALAMKLARQRGLYK